MGKLEDTLAEARMHMPSPSPIVGFGRKKLPGETRSQQMSATPIDYDTTPVLPINSSSAYKIPSFINNIRVNFLLDTGDSFLRMCGKRCEETATAKPDWTSLGGSGWDTIEDSWSCSSWRQNWT